MKPAEKVESSAAVTTRFQITVFKFQKSIGSADCVEQNNAALLHYAISIMTAAICIMTVAI